MALTFAVTPLKCRVTSVFCLPRLAAFPFLAISTGLSLAGGAGTPFAPSPLPLNSNPKPLPVCPPLFTPLLARVHVDVYLQRERGQLH